jgi:lipoprotein-anchoring transpeptidase ErfK/SrfK
MLSMHALRLSLFATLTLLITVITAAADVVITIDKSAQRMTVAVDGKMRWTWPVSTGAHGYDTPNGSYTAFRMEKDYSSKEWDDAPMPNSIFFTQRGHAIHGSYDTKHLGKPVSHGCVRLKPANAAQLYQLIEGQGVTNAKVVVTGRNI